MIADYVTRILATIGDRNPIDYSGGFVYCRKDNDHSPESLTAEIEWIDPPLGHGPRDSWDCPTCEGCGSGSCDSPPLAYASPEYRALACDCEACDGRGDWTCATCRGTGEDPALRWTVYRVQVEAYDWIDWRGVSDSTGVPPEAYAEAFASGEPIAMARAIEDYAMGFGSWYQLDQYPLSLTRAEVTARVRSLRAIEAQGPRFALGEAFAAAGYAATFTTLHATREAATAAHEATAEYLARNPGQSVDRLMLARAEALRIGAFAGEVST